MQVKTETVTEEKRVIEASIDSHFLPREDYHNLLMDID